MPLASISRAIFMALYSRCPPPMVSKLWFALMTIFEPALRGVEPSSSMMVTSTQGSPWFCRSARASIQLYMFHLNISVVCTGLFASKPAPTFGMHFNVGAGLLAKAAPRS
ncbi:hypothetical protein D9M71_410200 [compost metagenome]